MVPDVKCRELEVSGSSSSRAKEGGSAKWTIFVKNDFSKTVIFDKKKCFIGSGGFNSWLNFCEKFPGGKMTTTTTTTYVITMTTISTTAAVA